MRKIMIILDSSTDEMAMDSCYGYLVSDLGFAECIGDKSLPYTMLVKETDEHIEEIHKQVKDFIAEEKAEITNLFISYVGDYIHDSSDMCNEF